LTAKWFKDKFAEIVKLRRRGMLSRKYSVIIIPDSSDKVVNRQLSRNFIYSILAVVLIIAGAGLYAAIGYLTATVDNQRLTNLTEENKVLASKISELENTVYNLTADMSGIMTVDDRIRLIFDLAPIDADLREVGIGGLDENFHPVNSELAQRTWLLEEDIEKIQRQIAFENASFEELLNTVEKKKSALNHVPTIRPCDGILSRGFGMHNDPFTGTYQPHNGIDLAAPRGTPVFATGNGVVRYSGYQAKLGNTVIIDHGNGIRTYYGHLSKIKVNKGQRVSRHDLIGLVGSSGYSTGPHLHYEIRQGGRPVNPYKYIIRSILS
jgi:murein DD-endopeptidase MepM/ murein hydrolase activator NlpD